MERDGWRCMLPSCNLPANQCAHILPNDGVHLKRFGDEIINHRANMKAACGLKHNAGLQINYRNNPIAAEAQAQDVREAIKREATNG